MIHIDQVRISFRNCRAPAKSVERIAGLAMEYLEQMAGPEIERREGHRVLDRAQVQPLRISSPAWNEETLARTVAERAWLSILGQM